jgi:DNA-binding MarR family transcriptional regulator
MATTRKSIDPARAREVANCSCANLRKASRMVTQMFDAALKPTGVKATQFTLLAMLAKRGALPLTRFAELLGMDRTTLTRNLRPLIEKGLITVEGEADLRVRVIDLTEEGRAQFERARPAWEAVQQRFVEGLGGQRWSEFLDDLAAAVKTARGG